MSSTPAEHRPRVVLGVGGGIAAYKACEVLRRLTESGHAVRVVPTEAALRFVGAATFEALSGQPVATGVFTDVPEVPHVRIGQTADLVVVAPATADLMAKAAAGMADDLLTGTLLTARCPVLMVPAMHTEMWEHPATQANVATLRSRGVIVAEPASGRLTGKDTGKGRLPEPSEIVALATLLLERPDALPRDLTGQRVVISAGGTREPLDPVRYLTNRSSGKQGYALARVAAQRGAQVTLVSTVTGGILSDPAGVEVIPASTADQLREAVLSAAEQADVVVMAAAVADFRPAEFVDHKIKKTEGSEPQPLELRRNPDILVELVKGRRPGQLVVGFAAETGDPGGDVLDHARAKLARKGCDLLVVNAVGDGKAFEVEHNQGWLLTADGAEAPIPQGSKARFASTVWDAILRLSRSDRL
ncbi:MULTISPECIES: bifunctional phosphopantothenoylcysteine decarboxylase/phosphopantothenate--cysteine ligase CoaBC [unclassified Crossiella]|uniref:bifunctional phosphopantothenoylcysteine decarboxylase/phosphopantothenate--cysteine ligase CoaBC n=1 Tax=unclassified Crossiella TaxID=2620835 RepID=UPI001FFE4DE6|nr:MULTISPECIES: bifunctional phosphopantothenoylcysteine decarboxylase/phosphopantothenate--cysteine ligase CoaBC [unclassified Crossiella]MCK2239305.1 bifunctional phosphopantothenoylcysteine decarboxylase/phosphopantothenate--cysteine ligase CoaBC [Crossiella sp. S99.2]MCK2252000.1 bifunctional phosphopantothenoylcysteine decarboxylase/phosphopantothenate--cysteine ligase CoaBC [Crossiella sp. S99.1]